MSGLAPRLVLVTRETEFEQLLGAHATRGQAEFFLETRGQSISPLAKRHEQQLTAIDFAKRIVPTDWSIAEVGRKDLDRFLFTQDDIIVAIGQDGLVANLAKYLSGQPVIGVTPNPELTEGILTPLTIAALPSVLPRVAATDIRLQNRCMVEAKLDNGQTLAALNELFIGHRSHQSARYLLQDGEAQEFQSSSGIVVATGTGVTGWARSILNATHRQTDLLPEERRAIYFAREPWPSKTTGCELSFGEVSEHNTLSLTSRMNEGGVIFADGIEQDFLRFDWGMQATIALSQRSLNLVLDA
jgi:hypothetical protein